MAFVLKLRVPASLLEPYDWTAYGVQYNTCNWYRRMNNKDSRINVKMHWTKGLSWPKKVELLCFPDLLRSLSGRKVAFSHRGPQPPPNRDVSDSVASSPLSTPLPFLYTQWYLSSTHSFLLFKWHFNYQSKPCGPYESDNFILEGFQQSSRLGSWKSMN